MILAIGFRVRSKRGTQFRIWANQHLKEYLVKQDEIDTLNRLTTLFLDTAELRVKEHKDLTLRYWRETVDGLLNFQGKWCCKVQASSATSRWRHM